MSAPITLHVNGQPRPVTIDPETPLLFVLRQDLGLKGPKTGCRQEQCNACLVLIDGQAVPSCVLPVHQVAGAEITTIEGLAPAGTLHPLQEAFLAEQAGQCGYCLNGMIIAAQGLLNRTRYPTDAEIKTALSANICRCGVYERVRRAIKLRIARPAAHPLYTVIRPDPLPAEHDPAGAPANAAAALPRSLQSTPDLDAWIRINPDETITIFTGKVELGQGIKTALAQIAAEELDVDLARIRVQTADTAQTPDEGGTVGSMSLQTSGRALRTAAATARHLLLAIAFEELEAETSPAALVVADGTITDPATGRSTTYWALFAGRKFAHAITGRVPPKQADQHQLVGRPAPRLDLPAKVAGAPAFVHDLQLPGMLHGRVVRPPAYAARLRSVDADAARRMPGVVAVVQDGSFLAVVAAREEQAFWAAEALHEIAVWENNTDLPAPETLFDHLRHGSAQSTLVVDGTAVADPLPPPELPADVAANAAHILQASYTRPYQMHGSLAPSAATAQLVDGQLTIWSHTQAAPLLRQTVAQVLGLAADAVRVIHAEGAGCYGHNGADDAALDAALLARAVPGRPVLLKWSRTDEHAWEPYGPAMVVEMQAALDAAGQISAWHHDVWSYPQTGRPRPGTDHSGLLAAQHLADPFAPPPPRTFAGRHFGEYRNADPLYDLPHKRIVAHFVPDSPLRTSSLRSLGAFTNVFALESFMDELAYAAGIDPVAFRLQHLTDARARAVIQAAAEKAGWTPRTRPAGNGHGMGLAFAQYKNSAAYAAVVVQATVDQENGAVQLKRAVIAADAGEIVNPDGLSNQLEGGFMQAAGWTLAEQVTFDRQGITSRDWDSYPVLRMDSAPEMQVLLLDRPGFPFLGSGEAATGPTPAAIANAIHDATGIRYRDLPLTPTNIRRLS